MPTSDSANRMLSVTDDTLTGSHEKEIVGAGFSGRRGTLAISMGLRRSWRTSWTAREDA